MFLHLWEIEDILRTRTLPALIPMRGSFRVTHGHSATAAPGKSKTWLVTVPEFLNRATILTSTGPDPSSHTAGQTNPSPRKQPALSRDAGKGPAFWTPQRHSPPECRRRGARPSARAGS